MNVWKVSIVIMSTLIVVGLGFLVWGLTARTGDMAAAPPAAFETFMLPPGAVINSMGAWPGGVSLYATTAEGEFIYLYDTATGKNAGRVAVVRGETPAQP